MRSKVLKYVQIAEILKRRIANGNYMSQSFPGGPKLVAEFGVNYRTVRQAFQLLLDEGLLVRGENERLVQPLRPGDSGFLRRRAPEARPRHGSLGKAALGAHQLV